MKIQERERMSELLDVISEEGEVVGKETRKKIHRLGHLHRGAHVLVFDEKGSLLLQKRSPNTEISPGTYDISMSEHVKSGEDFHEAALRGLKEELGITDVLIRKLMRFKLVYGPGDRKVSELYSCQYRGVVVVDEDEVENATFVPLDDVKKMLTQDEKKFALWAREILKWLFEMPSTIERLNEPLK